MPQEILLEEARDVEGLIIQNNAVTEEFLAQLSQLKIIANIGVRYVSFALKVMREILENSVIEFNDLVSM
ncbi:hypothetical protein [Planococcus halocryophilus]|uniref:hypothetical protein n=1 Tax=Planococcus halocryophilus TaxID=1215089 RepID=UPI0009E2EED3